MQCSTIEAPCVGLRQGLPLVGLLTPLDKSALPTYLPWETPFRSESGSDFVALQSSNTEKRSSRTGFSS